MADVAANWEDSAAARRLTIDERDKEEDCRERSPALLLRTGILRLPRNKPDGDDFRLGSIDDSVMIGLSTHALKQLSVTSGSLVRVRNVQTKVERLGQVAVLDPPMLMSCALTEVAYLAPILAFNLGMHISCLNILVNRGKDDLASLFSSKVDDMKSCCEIDDAFIGSELEACTTLPKYASHLRVSYVKIPQCGTLNTLKGKSSIEAEDRQEAIDSALQDYFNVDRFLGRGDIFSVCVNWNCKSEACIPCYLRAKNPRSSDVYFKVVAMEPYEESILRVISLKLPLVLGGSVPSPVPPDLLIASTHEIGPPPLQQDTVKILASVLSPLLCSSTLSSRFRVAILLCGVSGQLRWHFCSCFLLFPIVGVNNCHIIPSNGGRILVMVNILNCCGKKTVVKHVGQRLGLHVVEFNCHNFMVASEKKVSSALTQAFDTAHRYAPVIVLLRHFEVFQNSASQEGLPNSQVGIAAEIAAVIRQHTEPVTEANEIFSHQPYEGDTHVKDAEILSRHRILLVAAADSAEGLPPAIRRCFSHEISMSPLTEEQRVELLSQSLRSVVELQPDIGLEEYIKDMAAQTSGFMPRDMLAMVADIGANLIPKPTNEHHDEESKGLNKMKVVTLDDSKTHKETPQTIGKEEFSKALERTKKRAASTLGTPKVPDVKWEDVGGLEEVKKSILDTVQLPLLHKDLFSSGLRKRSGVLLYGPPGTGKTLLAKAVATECSLNFLSVKGPELINMYIGESEKNVRDIFQKARSARPCVIFFDELDSLAPARGASGDSGGVMDRVVSQMLAEIDGLSDSSQDLFIIGASNRPDLIDPALLRPGRFDKLLYVGVNSEASYRERVLKAQTRKFKLHEDVSLYSVAMKCPPNFTGADMYALCADAWFTAAKRKVSKLETKSSTDDDDGEASVIVEYEDFMKVLTELSPSLSLAELEKYEILREQIEGTSK
ncbi:unnamed protein product [Rhodiola kirilowii]